jgi:hypothetical protein
MPTRGTLASLPLIGLLLAATAAPAHAAPSYAEIHTPSEGVLVAATGNAFDYPEDGSIIHIGAATAEPGGVRLSNAVLLDGRVRADQITAPTSGFGGLQVANLTVDDTPIATGPNTIATIPGAGYLVATQEATDGTQQAGVALRIHLLQPADGLEAGDEILVGPTGSIIPQPDTPTAATAISVLGFTLGPTGLIPAPEAGYPLAVRGTISACPFTPGSAHSPFVPPANLESDDAIDINIPVGTPVLAVADGTIGSQIGSLNSTDPRMAGLRVHLDTPTQHYYYAHLSQLDVIAGQHVVQGQELGLSGSAAGLPHLHFAQDGGNPADTIGDPTACPFFIQYNEPW